MIEEFTQGQTMIGKTLPYRLRLGGLHDRLGYLVEGEPGLT
ncbi:hypothetical protein [uncultured Pseudomonas sp.]|nr:hypothetical protein [uncultured Pseudomonas sp.]